MDVDRPIGEEDMIAPIMAPSASAATVKLLFKNVLADSQSFRKLVLRDTQETVFARLRTVAERFRSSPASVDSFQARAAILQLCLLFPLTDQEVYRDHRLQDLINILIDYSTLTVERPPPFLSTPTPPLELLLQQSALKALTMLITIGTHRHDLGRMQLPSLVIQRLNDILTEITSNRDALTALLCEPTHNAKSGGGGGASAGSAGGRGGRGGAPSFAALATGDADASAAGGAGGAVGASGRVVSEAVASNASDMLASAVACDRSLDGSGSVEGASGMTAGAAVGAGAAAGGGGGGVTKVSVFCALCEVMLGCVIELNTPADERLTELLNGFIDGCDALGQSIANSPLSSTDGATSGAGGGGLPSCGAVAAFDYARALLARVLLRYGELATGTHARELLPKNPITDSAPDPARWWEVPLVMARLLASVAPDSTEARESLTICLWGLARLISPRATAVPSGGQTEESSGNDRRALDMLYLNATAAAKVLLHRTALLGWDPAAAAVRDAENVDIGVDMRVDVGVLVSVLSLRIPTQVPNYSPLPALKEMLSTLADKGPHPGVAGVARLVEHALFYMHSTPRAIAVHAKLLPRMLDTSILKALRAHSATSAIMSYLHICSQQLTSLSYVLEYLAEVAEDWYKTNGTAAPPGAPPHWHPYTSSVVGLSPPAFAPQRTSPWYEPATAPLDMLLGSGFVRTDAATMGTLCSASGQLVTHPVRSSFYYGSAHTAKAPRRPRVHDRTVDRPQEPQTAAESSLWAFLQAIQSALEALMPGAERVDLKCSERASVLLAENFGQTQPLAAVTEHFESFCRDPARRLQLAEDAVRITKACISIAMVLLPSWEQVWRVEIMAAKKKSVLDLTAACAGEALMFLARLERRASDERRATAGANMAAGGGDRSPAAGGAGGGAGGAGDRSAAGGAGSGSGPTGPSASDSPPSDETGFGSVVSDLVSLAFYEDPAVVTHVAVFLANLNPQRFGAMFYTQIIYEIRLRLPSLHLLRIGGARRILSEAVKFVWDFERRYVESADSKLSELAYVLLALITDLTHAVCDPCVTHVDRYLEFLVVIFGSMSYSTRRVTQNNEVMVILPREVAKEAFYHAIDSDVVPLLVEASTRLLVSGASADTRRQVFELMGVLPARLYTLVLLSNHVIPILAEAIRSDPSKREYFIQQILLPMMTQVSNEVLADLFAPVYQQLVAALRAYLRAPPLGSQFITASVLFAHVGLLAAKVPPPTPAHLCARPTHPSILAFDTTNYLAGPSAAAAGVEEPTLWVGVDATVASSTATAADVSQYTRFGMPGESIIQRAETMIGASAGGLSATTNAAYRGARSERRGGAGGGVEGMTMKSGDGGEGGAEGAHAADGYVASTHGGAQYIPSSVSFAHSAAVAAHTQRVRALGGAFQSASTSLPWATGTGGAGGSGGGVGGCNASTGGVGSSTVRSSVAVGHALDMGRAMAELASAMSYPIHGPCGLPDLYGRLEFHDGPPAASNPRVGAYAAAVAYGLLQHALHPTAFSAVAAVEAKGSVKRRIAAAVGDAITKTSSGGAGAIGDSRASAIGYASVELLADSSSVVDAIHPPSQAGGVGGRGGGGGKAIVNGFSAQSKGAQAYARAKPSTLSIVRLDSHSVAVMYTLVTLLASHANVVLDARRAYTRYLQPKLVSASASLLQHPDLCTSRPLDPPVLLQDGSLTRHFAVTSSTPTGFFASTTAGRFGFVAAAVARGNLPPTALLTEHVTTFFDALIMLWSRGYEPPCAVSAWQTPFQLFYAAVVAATPLRDRFFLDPYAMGLSSYAVMSVSEYTHHSSAARCHSVWVDALMSRLMAAISSSDSHTRAGGMVGVSAVCRLLPGVLVLPWEVDLVTAIINGMRQRNAVTRHTSDSALETVATLFTACHGPGRNGAATTSTQDRVLGLLVNVIFSVTVSKDTPVLSFLAAMLRVLATCAGVSFASLCAFAESISLITCVVLDSRAVMRPTQLAAQIRWVRGGALQRLPTEFVFESGSSDGRAVPPYARPRGTQPEYVCPSIPHSSHSVSASRGGPSTTGGQTAAKKSAPSTTPPTMGDSSDVVVSHIPMHCPMSISVLRFLAGGPFEALARSRHPEARSIVERFRSEVFVSPSSRQNPIYRPRAQLLTEYVAADVLRSCPLRTALAAQLAAQLPQIAHNSQQSHRTTISRSSHQLALDPLTAPIVTTLFSRLGAAYSFCSERSIFDVPALAKALCEVGGDTPRPHDFAPFELPCLALLPPGDILTAPLVGLLKACVEKAWFGVLDFLSFIRIPNGAAEQLLQFAIDRVQPSIPYPLDRNYVSLKTSEPRLIFCALVSTLSTVFVSRPQVAAALTAIRCINAANAAAKQFGGPPPVASTSTANLSSSSLLSPTSPAAGAVGSPAHDRGSDLEDALLRATLTVMAPGPVHDVVLRTLATSEPPFAPLPSLYLHMCGAGGGAAGRGAGAGAGVASRFSDLLSGTGLLGLLSVLEPLSAVIPTELCAALAATPVHGSMSAQSASAGSVGSGKGTGGLSPRDAASGSVPGFQWGEPCVLLALLNVVWGPVEGSIRTSLKPLSALENGGAALSASATPQSAAQDDEEPPLPTTPHGVRVRALAWKVLTRCVLSVVGSCWTEGDTSFTTTLPPTTSSAAATVATAAGAMAGDASTHPDPLRARYGGFGVPSAGIPSSHASNTSPTAAAAAGPTGGVTQLSLQKVALVVLRLAWALVGPSSRSPPPPHVVKFFRKELPTNASATAKSVLVRAALAAVFSSPPTAPAVLLAAGAAISSSVSGVGSSRFASPPAGGAEGIPELTATVRAEYNDAVLYNIVLPLVVPSAPASQPARMPVPQHVAPFLPTNNLIGHATLYGTTPAAQTSAPTASFITSLSALISPSAAPAAPLAEEPVVQLLAAVTASAEGKALSSTPTFFHGEKTAPAPKGAAAAAAADTRKALLPPRTSATLLRVLGQVVAMAPAAVRRALAPETAPVVLPPVPVDSAAEGATAATARAAAAPTCSKGTSTVGAGGGCTFGLCRSVGDPTPLEAQLLAEGLPLPTTASVCRSSGGGASASSTRSPSPARGVAGGGASTSTVITLSDMVAALSSPNFLTPTCTRPHALLTLASFLRTVALPLCPTDPGVVSLLQRLATMMIHEDAAAPRAVCREVFDLAISGLAIGAVASQVASSPSYTIRNLTPGDDVGHTSPESVAAASARLRPVAMEFAAALGTGDVDPLGTVSSERLNPRLAVLTGILRHPQVFYCVRDLLVVPMIEACESFGMTRRVPSTVAPKSYPDTAHIQTTLDAMCVIFEWERFALFHPPTDAYSPSWVLPHPSLLAPHTAFGQTALRAEVPPAQWYPNAQLVEGVAPRILVGSPCSNPSYLLPLKYYDRYCGLLLGICGVVVPRSDWQGELVRARVPQLVHTAYWQLAAWISLHPNHPPKKAVEAVVSSLERMILSESRQGDGRTHVLAPPGPPPPPPSAREGGVPLTAIEKGLWCLAALLEDAYQQRVAALAAGPSAPSAAAATLVALATGNAGNGGGGTWAGDSMYNNTHGGDADMGDAGDGAGDNGAAGVMSPTSLGAAAAAATAAAAGGGNSASVAAAVAAVVGEQEKGEGGGAVGDLNNSLGPMSPTGGFSVPFGGFVGEGTDALSVLIGHLRSTMSRKGVALFVSSLPTLSKLLPLIIFQQRDDSTTVFLELSWRVMSLFPYCSPAELGTLQAQSYQASVDDGDEAALATLEKVNSLFHEPIRRTAHHLFASLSSPVARSRSDTLFKVMIVSLTYYTVSILPYPSAVDSLLPFVLAMLRFLTEKSLRSVQDLKVLRVKEANIVQKQLKVKKKLESDEKVRAMERHIEQTRISYQRAIDQPAPAYVDYSTICAAVLVARCISRTHTRGALLPLLARMAAECPYEHPSKMAFSYLAALVTLPSQNDARCVSVQSLAADRPSISQLSFLKLLLVDTHARALNAVAAAEPLTYSERCLFMSHVYSNLAHAESLDSVPNVPSRPPTDRIADRVPDRLLDLLRGWMLFPALRQLYFSVALHMHADAIASPQWGRQGYAQYRSMLQTVLILIFRSATMGRPLEERQTGSSTLPRSEAALATAAARQLGASVSATPLARLLFVFNTVWGVLLHPQRALSPCVAGALPEKALTLAHISTPVRQSDTRSYLAVLQYLTVRGSDDVSPPHTQTIAYSATERLSVPLAGIRFVQLAVSLLAGGLFEDDEPLSSEKSAMVNAHDAALMAVADALGVATGGARACVRDATGSAHVEDVAGTVGEADGSDADAGDAVDEDDANAAGGPRKRSRSATSGTNRQSGSATADGQRRVWMAPESSDEVCQLARDHAKASDAFRGARGTLAAAVGAPLSLIVSLPMVAVELFPPLFCAAFARLPPTERAAVAQAVSIAVTSAATDHATYVRAEAPPLPVLLALRAVARWESMHDEPFPISAAVLGRCAARSLWEPVFQILDARMRHAAAAADAAVGPRWSRGSGPQDGGDVDPHGVPTGAAGGSSGSGDGGMKIDVADHGMPPEPADVKGDVKMAAGGAVHHHHFPSLPPHSQHPLAVTAAKPTPQAVPEAIYGGLSAVWADTTAPPYGAALPNMTAAARHAELWAAVVWSRVRDEALIAYELHRLVREDAAAAGLVRCIGTSTGVLRILSLSARRAFGHMPRSLNSTLGRNAAARQSKWPTDAVTGAAAATSVEMGGGQEGGDGAGGSGGADPSSWNRVKSVPPMMSSLPFDARALEAELGLSAARLALWTDSIRKATNCLNNVPSGFEHQAQVVPDLVPTPILVQNVYVHPQPIGTEPQADPRRQLGRSRAVQFEEWKASPQDAFTYFGFYQLSSQQAYPLPHADHDSTIAQHCAQSITRSIFGGPLWPNEERGALFALLSIASDNDISASMRLLDQAIAETLTDQSTRDSVWPVEECKVILQRFRLQWRNPVRFPVDDLTLVRMREDQCREMYRVVALRLMQTAEVPEPQKRLVEKAIFTTFDATMLRMLTYTAKALLKAGISLNRWSSGLKEMRYFLNELHEKSAPLNPEAISSELQSRPNESTARERLRKWDPLLRKDGAERDQYAEQAVCKAMKLLAEHSGLHDGSIEMVRSKLRLQPEERPSEGPVARIRLVRLQAKLHLSERNLDAAAGTLMDGLKPFINCRPHPPVAMAVESSKLMTDLAVLLSTMGDLSAKASPAVADERANLLHTAAEAFGAKVQRLRSRPTGSVWDAYAFKAAAAALQWGHRGCVLRNMPIVLEYLYTNAYALASAERSSSSGSGSGSGGATAPTSGGSGGANGSGSGGGGGSGSGEQQHNLAFATSNLALIPAWCFIPFTQTVVSLVWEHVETAITTARRDDAGRSGSTGGSGGSGSRPSDGASASSREALLETVYPHLLVIRKLMLGVLDDLKAKYLPLILPLLRTLRESAMQAVMAQQQQQQQQQRAQTAAAARSGSGGEGGSPASGGTAGQSSSTTRSRTVADEVSTLCDELYKVPSPIQQLQYMLHSFADWVSKIGGLQPATLRSQDALLGAFTARVQAVSSSSSSSGANLSPPGVAASSGTLPSGGSADSSATATAAPPAAAPAASGGAMKGSANAPAPASSSSSELPPVARVFIRKFEALLNSGRTYRDYIVGLRRIIADEYTIDGSSTAALASAADAVATGASPPPVGETPAGQKRLFRTHYPLRQLNMVTSIDSQLSLFGIHEGLMQGGSVCGCLSGCACPSVVRPSAASLLSSFYPLNVNDWLACMYSTLTSLYDIVTIGSAHLDDEIDAENLEKLSSLRAKIEEYFKRHWTTLLNNARRPQATLVRAALRATTLTAGVLHPSTGIVPGVLHSAWPGFSFDAEPNVDGGLRLQSVLPEVAMVPSEGGFVRRFSVRSVGGQSFSYTIRPFTSSSETKVNVRANAALAVVMGVLRFGRGRAVTLAEPPPSPASVTVFIGRRLLLNLSPPQSKTYLQLGSLAARVASLRTRWNAVGTTAPTLAAGASGGGWRVKTEDGSSAAAVAAAIASAPAAPHRTPITAAVGGAGGMASFPLSAVVRGGTLEYAVPHRTATQFSAAVAAGVAAGAEGGEDGAGGVHEIGVVGDTVECVGPTWWPSPGAAVPYVEELAFADVIAAAHSAVGCARTMSSSSHSSLGLSAARAAAAASAGGVPSDDTVKADEDGRPKGVGTVDAGVFVCGNSHARFAAARAARAVLRALLPESWLADYMHSQAPAGRYDLVAAASRRMARGLAVSGVLRYALALQPSTISRPLTAPAAAATQRPIVHIDLPSGTVLSNPGRLFARTVTEVRAVATAVAKASSGATGAEADAAVEAAAATVRGPSVVSAGGDGGSVVDPTLHATWPVVAFGLTPAVVSALGVGLVDGVMVDMAAEVIRLLNVPHARSVLANYLRVAFYEGLEESPLRTVDLRSACARSATAAVMQLIGWLDNGEAVGATVKTAQAYAAGVTEALPVPDVRIRALIAAAQSTEHADGVSAMACAWL